MDIRRIVRAMRYSQMEQQPNPKTGERMVPPSIKFAVFLVLVAFVGTMLWMVNAQLPGTGDAGGALEQPTPSADSNNTTEPDATPQDAPTPQPATNPDLASLIRTRDP